MKQTFVLTVADYFVKISSEENVPVFFEEGYSNFLQLEEVENYDATVVCHAGLPEKSAYTGEVIFDGKDDMLVAVILLLIDHLVPGVGHRKALLNPAFTRTGAAVRFSREGRAVMVQDLSCPQ
jgi:hypothetical protein